jgi:hypothetical protein
MKGNEAALPVLPSLAEIFVESKIEPKRCSCGSFAFFDWGVKLLSMIAGNYGGSKRSADWEQSENVLICASCQKPVVQHDGKLYDASEFISAAEVKQLIEYGAARRHKTPLRAMDP